MPLYSVSETEIRDHCKRAIEGLEVWLRRLIDTKLSDTFGADYVDAIRVDGSRVINSNLARTLTERRSREPKRFSRLIDATLLDEQIAIICNPLLYKNHFRDALDRIFPQGNECARTLFGRLLKPRHMLYHANPLSIHDAYRVLCYSMDVVEGLKTYYEEMNMSQLYNVPSVIRVCDSLGRVNHPSSNRLGPAILDHSEDQAAYLRCGDTISVDVDVDPAFDPEEYQVEWQIANIRGPKVMGKKFHLLLTDQYVSTRFCVVCRVTSNKNWHKLGTCDDQIDIAYRVLPPL